MHMYMYVLTEVHCTYKALLYPCELILIKRVPSYRDLPELQPKSSRCSEFRFQLFSSDLDEQFKLMILIFTFCLLVLPSLFQQ
jgi:hypothetical protein